MDDDAPLSDVERAALGAMQAGITYYEKKNDVGQMMLTKVIVAMRDFMESSPQEMHAKVSTLKELLSELDTVGSILGVNFDEFDDDDDSSSNDDCNDNNDNKENRPPFAV